MDITLWWLVFCVNMAGSQDPDIDKHQSRCYCEDIFKIISAFKSVDFE